MSRSNNVFLSQAQSGRLNPDFRAADFSGGRVNVPEVLQAAQVDDTQLIKCQNVDVTGGSLRKMLGFSKQTSSAITNDVTNIWYDTFTQKTVVSYDNKLGELNGAGTAITQWTGATGFTTNAAWSFCRLNDHIFCFSPLDAPKKWDGTTLTSITSPPVTWTAGNYPKFGVTWMGRVFAVQDNSDILYFSDLFDGDVWTAGTAADAAGAMTIGNDGIPITALVPLDQGLLIFKESGLYYLTGTYSYSTTHKEAQFDQTSFDWQLVSSEVGCVGWRAAIAVNQSVYAWGKQGVYTVTTSDNASVVASVTNIGLTIMADIKRVTTLYDNICAAHYSDRGQIWWAVSATDPTKIDTVHCYDYLNVKSGEPGGWMLRKGYTHRCMANTRIAGRQEILSGGYSGNGYLFLQNDSNNFDGAAMECIVWTAWFPLGLAARGKPNFMTIFLGPQPKGVISHTYAFDFATDYYESNRIEPPESDSTWNSTASSTYGATYGSGTTGTYTTGQPFFDEFRLFGNGRRIQHRFYSNEVDASFDILEIVHSVTSLGYA